MSRPLQLLCWYVLLLSSPLSMAQEQGQEPALQPIAADRLEYFLLQSFHATHRTPLNHLGLLVAATNEGYRISTVLDGFPAQQVGLRRGDLLIAIDGEPFHPVLSLNPQPGDGPTPTATARQVELQFSRNGVVESTLLQPVFGNLFDAFRSATGNSVQQFSNGNKLIGYVKLWSLDRSANGIQSFRQLIDSLSHCDGLILDLRDSYGFVNANHFDRFLSSRTSLFELSGTNSDLWQQTQPVRAAGRPYGRAMAIIQNSGTRGGAELFSYQLAGLQRVISVGDTSSGKAGKVILDRSSGQVFYRPDHELLVDGIPLEGRGIEAEVNIPYPLSSSLATDPQLDAAVLSLMEII